MRFRPQAKLDPVRLVHVVHEWPGAVLVPPVSVKLDLEASAAAPKAVTAPVKGARLAGGKAASKPTREPSWWTARATAGQVTAGFTKEEILKKPESDPRAEGGMFSRLEGLLRALG